MFQIINAISCRCGNTYCYTLHKNEQGPEAVLYKQNNRYIFIPYHYDGTSI